MREKQLTNSHRIGFVIFGQFERQNEPCPIIDHMSCNEDHFRSIVDMNLTGEWSPGVDRSTGSSSCKGVCYILDAS